MTVKELKKLIENLPDDMLIILQKDSEGNNYSPLQGIDCEAVYIPDSTYSGDVYNTRWSTEDTCKTESEWVEIKKYPRCLVLYPIN